MKQNLSSDFTLSLVIVDCFPCIFFALSSLIIMNNFRNIIFIIGTILIVFAGFSKVIWKLILVINNKDIPFFFWQLRISMPIGFILVIISLVNNRKKINWDFIKLLYKIPYAIFLAITMILLFIMVILGIKCDKYDKKVNWIEQIINSIAQGCVTLTIYLISKKTKENNEKRMQ